MLGDRIARIIARVALNRRDPVWVEDPGYLGAGCRLREPWSLVHVNQMDVPSTHRTKPDGPVGGALRVS